MTGMRPRACSTAVLISWQCSSTLTVGDSPVVPTTTMPAVPLATWKSISLRSAGRSSAPPGCIGVTIATRLPVSIETQSGKSAILPDSKPASARAGTRIGTSARGNIRRQRRRPAAAAPDGRDALHDGRASRRRPRPCSNATTVSRSRNSDSSSSAAQQEIGIRRPAVGFVAARRTSRTDSTPSSASASSRCGNSGRCR